jgi:hypothetical protein
VLVERCFALERATWGEGTCATRQCFSRYSIYFRDSLIAGGFRQQRRNVIAASGTSLNNADAAFGGLAKGPALFAVPITERAPGSISKILCGYFQDGSAGSSGVILSLSSPDLEAISGARMINVSLEKVVVQISADPVTGKDVCVSSAVDGAKLFSIPSDVSGTFQHRFAGDCLAGSGHIRLQAGFSLWNLARTGSGESPSPRSATGKYLGTAFCKNGDRVGAMKPVRILKQLDPALEGAKSVRLTDAAKTKTRR